MLVRHLSKAYLASRQLADRILEFLRKGLIIEKDPRVAVLVIEAVLDIANAALEIFELTISRQNDEASLCTLGHIGLLGHIAWRVQIPVGGPSRIGAKIRIGHRWMHDIGAHVARLPGLARDHTQKLLRR